MDELKALLEKLGFSVVEGDRFGGPNTLTIPGIGDCDVRFEFYKGGASIRWRNGNAFDRVVGKRTEDQS